MRPHTPRFAPPQRAGLATAGLASGVLDGRPRVGGAGAGASGQSAPDMLGSRAGWKAPGPGGRLSGGGAAARDPGAPWEVLWRRLAARSLLPPAPARRASARAGCHLVKATGRGCFMGREKGPEVMLPSSAAPGPRAPKEGTPLGRRTAGGGEGEVEAETLGRDSAEPGRGRPLGRDPELTSRPSCSLLAPAEPPLQSRAQPTAPALPLGPQGGGGETFSPETLDTNFVFWARKISLVWKGGGVGGGL